jgi:hypothetical protein
MQQGAADAQNTSARRGRTRDSAVLCRIKANEEQRTQKRDRKKKEGKKVDISRQ